MRPLIKWPGGKSSEIKYIYDLIPEYDRYIEPFFGGGAVFFQLEPQKAVINDISTDLMAFYSFIKLNNSNFKRSLRQYDKHWSGALTQYIKILYPSIYDVFLDYRNDKLEKKMLERTIKTIIEGNYKLLDDLFQEQFIIDLKWFLSELLCTVPGKLLRMRKLEIKKSTHLSEEDIEANIETGFRSGFYTHFRNIYNDILLKRGIAQYLPKEAKVATFYFIREFCYGSMFRYNTEGEFNIPYGGISYNKKNFTAKLDRLFNLNTIQLFDNTDIYNLDFERFLNSINITERDFMFVDPPYDSDFSDYEGRVFDLKEQKRLANYLYTTKASFISIIKNTEFIYNLYSGKPGIHILEVDTQYKYNVRSRNNRKTQHLLITNFQPITNRPQLI